MRDFKILPLAYLIGMGALPTVQAITVVEYNFTGDSLAASSVDSNASASLIGGGAGASVAALTPTSHGYSSAPVLNIGASTATVNSLADAVSQNVFYEFTFTPNSGFQVSFNSLSGSVARSANSSTRGWQLRSSIDSYASVLAEDSSINAQRAFGFEAMSASSGSLNLAGVSGLQNVTSAVTFRIYANTGTGGSSNPTRTLDFDNLVLDGTVAAIPEPSTYALLILGAGGLALARRRKRQ